MSVSSVNHLRIDACEWMWMSWFECTKSLMGPIFYLHVTPLRLSLDAADCVRALPCLASPSLWRAPCMGSCLELANRERRGSSRASHMHMRREPR